MPTWNLGRHRKKDINQVPTEYLLWFLKNDGTGYMAPKRKHRAMAVHELRTRGVEVPVQNRATELGVKTADRKPNALHHH